MARSQYTKYEKLYQISAVCALLTLRFGFPAIILKQLLIVTSLIREPVTCSRSPRCTIPKQELTLKDNDRPIKMKSPVDYVAWIGTYLWLFFWEGNVFFSIYSLHILVMPNDHCSVSSTRLCAGSFTEISQWIISLLVNWIFGQNLII